VSGYCDGCGSNPCICDHPALDVGGLLELADKMLRVGYFDPDAGRMFVVRLTRAEHARLSGILGREALPALP
jgi:hypothetical protein